MLSVGPCTSAVEPTSARYLGDAKAMVVDKVTVQGDDGGGKVMVGDGKAMVVAGKVMVRRW